MKHPYDTQALIVMANNNPGLPPDQDHVVLESGVSTNEQVPASRLGFHIVGVLAQLHESVQAGKGQPLVTYLRSWCSQRLRLMTFYLGHDFMRHPVMNQCHPTKNPCLNGQGFWDAMLTVTQA